MSRRRQQNSWIHRRSRLVMTAIAIVGALGTAYLTAVKLMGGNATCPTEGCEQVLSSSYADIFGLPLTLFGCLAYSSMAILAAAPLFINPEDNKDLRVKLENSTWLLLFIGATAMTIFSGYLMYLLIFQIKVVCIYCVTSALLSLSLLILTVLGRVWQDRGQLLFTGFIVGILTLVGTVGLYAIKDQPPTPGVEASGGEVGLPITTTSGASEIALAKHLKAIGATMYGAYWCPHCHDQKQLFGQQALAEMPYVECDPKGANAQVEVCQSKGSNLTGYPSWEINGEFYAGTQTLARLAELSGYQGSQDFKN